MPVVFLFVPFGEDGGEITLMTEGLLFGIALVSALLQGTIGFGAAIVMINILPLFMSPGTSIVVTQFACTISSLYIVIKIWRKVRLDVLLPLLIPCLVCTFVATKLSVGLDTSTMKVMLGVVFILLAIYFSFVADKISLKPTKFNGAIVGCISGVVGGMFVAGGPPAVLYLAPALEDKDEYVATIQLYFVALNTISLLTRVFSNAVALEDLKYMLNASVGMLIGGYFSLKLGKNLKGTLLKRFIFTFVGINGVVMIINNLSF